MIDPPKILYIVVMDEEERGSDGDEGGAFRYTRPVLQSTLQLMGCKPRHAFKISRTVFDVMRNECKKDGFIDAVADLAGSDTSSRRFGRESRYGLLNRNKTNETIDISSIQFELYKRQTTVIVAREIFLSVVCDALSTYKYVGPNQRIDLLLACRIRERKESVTILLCGTSGCGKSTLSALLASRLGITTVISTDSIRHMMRSFVDEKENPLLWSSTYHAGEFLDPTAVAEAKAKRKAKRLAPSSEKRGNQSLDADSSGFQAIGKTQMAVEGFKAQSEMVIDSLDRLITAWESQKQSVIVEGVHLSLNFVMGLMKRHRSIIPFMIHIAREDKHVERFAVRAKYMTLDPSKNKYVKYIRNIRRIQEYLCNRADKHLVPKINNTNVDRSVAAIHATVFSCLRRREAGEQLYDPTTNTVPVIQQEHRNQCAANSLSSKRMFQLIQRLGSSRHLMALVNTDGSVAKAWPVEPVESCAGSPVYGPLQIGKAEPINLQFGNYGISAWPNDAGSIGSCSSSPGLAGGALKEPMEEASVSGSEDEEAIEPRAAESEEDDPSDIEPESVHEEMEGSVDEESAGSDEEYDDLAMKDDGYSSGESEPANSLLEEDECSRKMRRCRSHSDRNQRSKGERIRNHARILGRSRSIPASFAVPQPRSRVGIQF